MTDDIARINPNFFEEILTTPVFKKEEVKNEIAFQPHQVMENCDSSEDNDD